MKTLEKWIDKCQSKGNYTFLRSEAYCDSGLTEEAAKKALRRLAIAGRIANVTRNFFVIVPLEYSQSKSPPASWYIDSLMRSVQAPYYVGLLSAAALHGSSHHAPQEFQVISNRFFRPIEVGRTRIRFFTNKYVTAVATQGIKTPTGTMQVSTVETTLVDLIRFSRSTGQLDNVATVIGELQDLIDSKKLLAAAKIVKDVPNMQRLGYVLDQVGAGVIAKPLLKWLEKQDTRPIPLRTGHQVSRRPVSEPWQVIVDSPLEIET